MAQICIILNRHKKWVQFPQYLDWVENRHTNRETSPWSKADSVDQSDTKICNSKDNTSQRLVPYQCSAAKLEGVGQVVKSKSHSRHVKGTNAVNLKLTEVPHCKNTMHMLAKSYNAPMLLVEIAQLVQRLKLAPELAPEPLARAVHLLSTRHALVWDRIQVAIPTVQNPYQLTKHQTIPAEPPSPKAPVGRCGTVLLHWSSEAETVGIKGKWSLDFIHAGSFTPFIRVSSCAAASHLSS